MSTQLAQSAWLQYPAYEVWGLIRPLDFLYYHPVMSHKLEGSSVSNFTVGGERTFHFRDGTTQRVRLLELSDVKHEITWEVLESSVALSFSSCIHTVRVTKVTSDNTALVEWVSDFSKDVTAEALADWRFKQQDHFKALEVELAKPFNFYSTAEEVVKKQDLKGKVIIVTGANTGIGFEAARVLTQRGAHVIGTVRDSKKAQDTEDRMRKATDGGAAGSSNSKQDTKGGNNNGGKFEAALMELSSLKSVRAFAEGFIKRKLPLHVLVNNAGIMGVPFELTEDKFESQFGVNHMAHFYLTQLLLPVLKATAPSRIVVLSSHAHRMHGINWDDVNWGTGYDKWKAYGQSKTANILFARYLNAQLTEQKAGVTVNALHPGVIDTDLWRSLQGNADQAALSKNPARLRLKSIEQGAATTVFAATDAALGKQGGLYLSDCGPTTWWPSASRMGDAVKLWALSQKLLDAALAKK